MEEEKAAAYYEELTRKGEGAARFKQGLGFSSSSTGTHDGVPARGAALPSTSSSFLSSFVKASTSPTRDSEFRRQAQLESIQSKLKKKPPNFSQNQSQSSSRVSDERTSRDVISRDGDRHSRNRIRSRSREDSRSSHRHRRRSRSRDEDEVRDRHRDRERTKRRQSRSRSIERGRRGRARSRSMSPGKDRRSDNSRVEELKAKKEGSRAIDYSKLIDGYDKMSPAERVKAKMKLQLSETAKKDATNGMGSGWERFDFDKDAPLDDEEIEAGDDDKELVRHIGQSFRLSAVEAKREENIRATHDEAIFGTPSLPPPFYTDSEDDDKNKIESLATAPVASLLSDQVRTMQQGSWRERSRKV